MPPLIVVLLAAPMSSWRPPLMIVPAADAPDTTTCVPPLIVVLLAVPKFWWAPLVIVVPVARPSDGPTWLRALLIVAVAGAPGWSSYVRRRLIVVPMLVA